MDVALSASEIQSQQQPQQSSGASGGLQIRSRVTVVCAECKRLKLKCDRRTPCGSCTKRDTVARCVYSPAAAEKVDLHSLNNRLSQVESQLAQFTASGPRCHPHHPKASGSSHPDRVLLAVGKSGSSLAISLDDITTIWLDELDLGKELHPVQELSPQRLGLPHANSSQVKLESPMVTLPGKSSTCSLELPIPLLLPPISAYFAAQSPSPDDAPCVTSRLMAHLPFAPRKRQRLYDNVEDVLKMHPCFNFKHFKDRAEAMFRWGSEADSSDDGALDSSSPGHPSLETGGMMGGQKAELARAIFFGPPSATPVSASKGPSPAKPTLSFFAAVAAAFALGTLVDREVADEEARIHAAAQCEGIIVDGPSTSRPASRRRTEVLPTQGKKGKNTQKDSASYPSVLLGLSQQALALFEKNNSYDLDFLVTMILHVLYMLHDSKARVAHNLLPDVGKMVNVARTMGLDADPDEFPGTFNLFDAEARRRLWWDIFYYDLFVSDYMGRSALISDTEHTTRLPMDVDEDVFTPACTSIPLPRSPLSLLEPNVSDFKYFGLKCSLARLVKDIKKRSLKDFLQNDPEAQAHYSLEQAMACASAVKQWLAELPVAFRLDVDSDLSNSPSSQRDVGASSIYSSPSGDCPTASPVLLAQRCELIVTAQRLIMKIYVPFLRPSNGHTTPTAHYQAAVGIFTAAHTIIRAIRVLCSMWKQRPDLKGRRPTPALFSFYSFGRTLFDAAVACAHNVIKDPTSVWARTAMEDVNYALEVMRDPVLNTGRGPMRGGIEGDVHEAIMIIVLLQKKAELARHGKLDVSSGMKRKRDEPENESERLPDGFQIPFIGGTVSSTNLDCAPPSLTTHSGSCVVVTTNSTQEKDISPSEELPKRLTPPVPPSSKRSQTDSRDSKCKDKGTKKACYPRTGVRVRPVKDAPPFCRLRTPSSSGTPERNESALSSSRTPVIPSSQNTEHPPCASGFMPPSQSAPSPGVREAHHQTVTQVLPGDPKLDFQVPFGTGDQSGPSLGRVSQPSQYISSDNSDSAPMQKISPSGSSYEPTQSPSNSANPMPYAQPNTDYPDSPFTTSGPPNALSATQVSRTPSAHNQPTSFMGEIPGPPRTYYSFDSRYEGNVNDPPLMGLSIHPSMTFHTNGENAQFPMEIPCHDLPLHRQEKSQPPPGYMTKPPEHHHQHAQRQFSGPPQSQTVAHSWQPDGIIQDGFWRTAYDQFMPS